MKCVCIIKQESNTNKQPCRCKTTQKQAPRGSKGRETHGKNQIDAAETDGCEGQTAGRGNGA